MTPQTAIPRTTDFAEKRRILQLETLYDLALALHADRPEGELVEELLQRVCTVLDPAAAVAVTRDAIGEPRAIALRAPSIRERSAFAPCPRAISIMPT